MPAGAILVAVGFAILGFLPRRYARKPTIASRSRIQVRLLLFELLLLPPPEEDVFIGIFPPVPLVGVIIG